MMNMDLECRLVAQRIEELRRSAARTRLLRAARTPRAAEGRPGRVVELRRVPNARPERT